ncbi:sigma-70 family RNA polymerase sigma factor [Membranicola marinus]|uniref:Sigma-70 family RNA polymerase sigma factor n=1 Tax=Membranihabitans marinus TaxID=1227546 RepID=A0A953HZ64_9BACT|nr:sigma-70 family RNA polymerase sigma factor [Membranihabitans marinus]MBY5959386.1 sigma-70 family RNA polymerase sigma factor [Membranihabitans marinus]
MNWKRDIYKEYQDKIYGFILFHIKSEELALDLTHDVFVRLYASYTLDKIDNIESVIWTITRNRIVDHHRKVAHSRKYREYLWGQVNSTNPIMNHIEHQETKALFKAALTKLTPQQWRIYNMAREKDLSYREIGKELKISPNTVKNHMVQALRILRTYLRDHQEDITFILLLSAAIV